MCTGAGVLQGYRCTGVVQCYSGTSNVCVRRTTGVVWWYNGYRAQTAVQVYRRSASVQGYKCSKGLLRYRYSSVKWYWSNTVIQLGQ